MYNAAKSHNIANVMYVLDLAFCFYVTLFHYSFFHRTHIKSSTVSVCMCLIFIHHDLRLTLIEAREEKKNSNQCE